MIMPYIQQIPFQSRKPSANNAFELTLALLISFAPANIHWTRFVMYNFRVSDKDFFVAFFTLKPVKFLWDLHSTST